MLEKLVCLFRCCEIEDLLEKYHGKVDIVDGIIADKVALGDTEKNPDCPGMLLYNCWDATATIKNDATERSNEVIRSGAITGEMASAVL